MRLGIATENGNVAGHFGRCSVYTFVDIEDNKVVNKNEIVPPGHQPGTFPKFLKENNANYVIAGGMGSMAIKLFEEFNITPILGVSGSINEIVNKFIAGNLESGDSACNHDSDEHNHQCNH